MNYEPFSIKFIQTALKSNGLWLSKNRGQNYLIDKNTAEKIVAAIPKNVTIFEVGSGLGALTSLMSRGHTVFSVEIDGGVYRLLDSLLQNPSLSLINDDFLKFDMNTIPENKLFFASNLPYSISGEAIKKFIECPKFDRGLLMLQKEFVERMTAIPGTKKYGILAILSQTYLTVNKLFKVGKNCFFPAPTIDSVVVEIQKLSNKLPTTSQIDFKNFLSTAFSNRRKTIANNFKNFNLPKEFLINNNIIPGLRPEQLTVEEWQSLFKNYEKLYSTK